MRVSWRSAWCVGMSLGLASMVSGCVSIRNHRGYIVDKALVDSVMPGIDNRRSVEGTLGRPTFVSQFGNKDWYYISMDTKQPAFRKTHTEKELAVRVRFNKKGTVIGVDRTGMKKVVRISPNGDKTPTLGRKRSILEDLFGNVGAVGMPGAGPGGGGGGNTGPNGS